MYEENLVFFFISVLGSHHGVYVRPTEMIKKKSKLSSYIRKSVAKSYVRNGFLIYEEMRKYLVIYKEAVSHI